MPSRPGITRSSTTASIAGASGAVSSGDRGVAAIDDDGLIAALLHHVFDQTALYGVVVGDQNGGSHGFPRTFLLSVSNRGTLADAD